MGAGEFLREGFLYVRCAGIWPPAGGQLASPLHKCFTLLTFGLMSLALLTMGSALVVERNNLQVVAQIGYIFVTAFISFVKGMNLLLHRDDVERMVQAFAEPVCLKASEEEASRCRVYDLYCRYLPPLVFVLGNFTVTAMNMLPLFFTPEGEEALPYRAWHPFALTGLVHCAVYATQSISLYVICIWNSSTDVLMFSFMMQVCAQLELLTHRLGVLATRARSIGTSSGYEAAAIRSSVRQHLQIFRIVEMVKAHFLPNVLTQFLLCNVTICLTILQLASIEQSSQPAEFAKMAAFLYTMLVELACFCWFGNEVIVKSANFGQELFQTDWTALSIATQKKLLIMMMRARTPIRITCGPFITLSAESFTGIIKLSYSMFNVLKQSS